LKPRNQTQAKGSFRLLEFLFHVLVFLVFLQFPFRVGGTFCLAIQPSVGAVSQTNAFFKIVFKEIPCATLEKFYSSFSSY
jgi:hypothetical protein